LVLLTLAATQGVLWSLFTAPLNGPDEAAHAAYVQTIAETGTRPSRTSGTGSTSTVLNKVRVELGLGPMLGHVEARPDADNAPNVEREIERLPDRAWKDGTGPNAVAQNPPLYYAYAAMAYRLSPDRSILGRLFAVRLATVALYVGTVFFAWLLASELFSPLWQRFTASALVALQPKLVAMGAVINPDTLLFMVSTGFLWMSARLVLRGWSTPRVAGVAAFAGAAALTHGRGLYLIPALAVALLVALIRHRPTRVEIVRASFAAVGVLLVAAVVITGWKAPQGGGAAYGGEVRQSAPFNVKQFLSYVFQFYFGPFSFLQSLGPPHGYRQVYIETFFGAFGSLEVNYRPSAYDLLQIGAAIGLAAFGATVVARWSAVKRQRPLWVLALGTFGSLLLVLHVSAYRDLVLGGDPLLTGRYLLPVVGLYAVAVTWVVGSLPQLVRLPAAGVVLALATALTMQGLLLEATRFYV
jgi:hypothetical protein